MKHLKKLLILIVLLGPVVTDAQLNQFTDTSATIVSSPRHPEPNAEVVLTLNAFSIDTQGATVRWFVDGIEQIQAQNERSLLVTTGNLGETTTVTAQITLKSGFPLTLEHQIDPVRLDLIFEANTTVPGFYEGKALPSADSLVRAIALPFEFTTQAPENYSYLWSLNQRVLFGGSIKAKNVAEIALPIGRDHVISVDVIDDTGSVIASRAVQVPTFDPEVYFYTDNPLRGTSQTSITSDFILVGNEVTIKAEPYYIDDDIFLKQHLIEWGINNENITNPNEDPLTITLQNGGGTGVFTINFHIRNLEQLLQGIRTDFTVRF